MRRTIRETAVIHVKRRSAVTMVVVWPSIMMVLFVVWSVGLHSISGTLTRADQVRNIMYAEMTADYERERVVQ